MSLLRRRIRTQIIHGFLLARENVVSHTAGAISVMVRPQWGGLAELEDFADFVVRWLGDRGYEVEVVRSGVTRRGVWYVTVTNQALADEGWVKYGKGSMRAWLEARAASVAAEGSDGDGEVGVAVALDDLDGDLELPDVEMEALEASEM